MEEKIYKVVVDYGKSLDEMIKAKKHGWLNERYINDKYFSISGKGKQKVVLVLVYLNHAVTTRVALEYMKNHGLEPARIEHLLAFERAYPKIQYEFPILALGSFVRIMGSNNYPCLDCDVGRRRLRRRLDLYWRGDDHRWCENCRFLAVRM